MDRFLHLTIAINLSLSPLKISSSSFIHSFFLVVVRVFAEYLLCAGHCAKDHGVREKLCRMHVLAVNSRSKSYETKGLFTALWLPYCVALDKFIPGSGPPCPHVKMMG